MTTIVYRKKVKINTSTLNLRDKQITEIQGLDALVNLQELNLSMNKISKIQGLDALVNLQELYLSLNKITKIQRLNTLVNLQELNLSMNKITKIQGLDALINLQKLYLGCNQITEIQGLDALVNLQYLDLSGNKITEIQGLDALVNLQKLDLNYNKITKIQGLGALVNLQKLDLNTNQITKIQGLDALVNLRELQLYNNKITEIQGLDALSQLNSLNLHNNQITKIQGLDALVNLVFLELSNNRIKIIPNIQILNNLTYFYINNNPLIPITTSQRTALEKQVLRYRGQIKDKKLLVPPKEATEWMNICRNLDQNYHLEDLKNLARTANITLSMDGKPKTKRQLCVDLARQYTRLQQRTRHKSGCENDSDLTGNDFDILNRREYVRMPGGYCLSLADIAGLAPQFIDPFTRKKLSRSVIDYYKRYKHFINDTSGVHELKPVGEAYKHQETAMRLANILNSTERKIDGNRIEVIPGDTKYFDVGRLLVDKGTIDEYRRVIKRQKLIQDLQLEDYFRIGAPIVEYYDAMVDSLKWIKQNRFDLLETLKWLYVEVMSPR